jgi:hypothetical protein
MMLLHNMELFIAQKENQQFMVLGLHKNCRSRAEIGGVGNHVSGFGRI